MHLIGIVGRCYYNKDGQKIVQTHDAVRRLLANRDDCVCITLLPPEDKIYEDESNGRDIVSPKMDYILDKCDAFIVPGGTYAYHFDEYVINYAIKNDKPLLCICLGFQVLCSMFAKNRTDFYMAFKDTTELHHGKPDEYSHKVNIKENTLLKEIIKDNSISVNSVHNDIINFAMDTLVVNAVAEDNVIEGVEYPGKKFILGLQWHPEYLVDENTKKITDIFVDFM